MQYQAETSLEYAIIHFRWLFVCIFVLPISLVFNIWLFFRNWIVHKLNSAPNLHANKVLKVQLQILEWNKSGRKTKLCTARPGWQTVSFRRPVYKDTLYKIEVNLVDILDIDTERQVVKCEPLVTIGQLTATLNSKGWTLPIVPELEELTIGGMVMGTGVESSSHTKGLFQNICLSYELVLSNGQILICSATQNTDLFYAVSWSHGSLGILTAVELKIIRAKKYVKLRYEPVRGLTNIAKRMCAVNGDPKYEFVEGLLYNQNEAVIMTGNQTNEVETNKINCLGRWYKPWFFTHAKEVLRKDEAMTEYIPLRSYYHRHTRSLFWEMQDIIPFGNNLLFRLFLGWLVPPKISLLKLTQTEATTKLYNRCHVIQDLLVPMKNLEESILKLDKIVEIYPIWLCAFVLEPNPGFVHPKDMSSPEMYVDIGIYGTPHVDDYHPRKTTQKLEQHLRDVNGFQMLYADIYMTREEFRQMFDHKLYDQTRKKYKCQDAFPEVYDKVSKAARH